MGKLISRFRVKPLAGARDFYYGAARECPSCQHALPANIERAKNSIVLLVGTPGSGKTCWLATAIYELLSKDVALALGGLVVPLNEDVESAYRQSYFEPLFHTRGAPHQVPDHQPLIYTLKRAGQRDVNLIFYEISGENLPNAAEVARLVQLILHTDALLVLEDLLAFYEIEQRARPAAQPPALAARAKGEDVLYWLAELYRRQHQEQRAIRVPTAITLSKSDVLRGINQYAHYRFFDKPPYKAPSYPRILQSDFDAVDVDVRHFLKSLENQAGLGLLHRREPFQQAHFFAVSSTGEAPDAAGHFPAIEPLRVLDPLLWILCQLGVISPHDART